MKPNESQYGSEPVDQVRWQLSNTGDLDWPWELSNSSTSCFQLDRLQVSRNSNSSFMFKIRVRGGSIGMTSEQMQHVVAEWLRFNCT